MKNILRILIITAIFGYLAGCAMTVEQVPIKYSAPTNLKVKNSNNVKIGKITDERSLSDPTMIMHKKNMYGDTMSGGYKAEKPLAVIIENSLAEIFQKNKGGNYELYGSLEEFNYEVVSSWFSAKVKPKMIVKLYLRDTAKHKIIWNDTIIAKGVVDAGGFSGDHEIVKKLVKVAIDDFLTKVSSSDMLKQYL